MIIDAETCVLIVGGGPVGLSAAIELGWRGVPTILISERLETAQHPECNSTNARSMEHFRAIADGSAGRWRFHRISCAHPLMSRALRLRARAASASLFRLADARNPEQRVPDRAGAGAAPSRRAARW
ncbi:FAD-dependent monooxygenase [Bradyrhizobium sp. RDT10]